jgi:formyl-CoA transferase
VFVVNTPHPARKEVEAEYDDVTAWNARLIYADLTGFGEKGPMPICPASTSRPLGAQRPPSMTRDAGAPRPGQWAERRQCHRDGPLFGDRHGALSSRAHRQGSYVTTSLLAEGVWSASVSSGALAGAKFAAPHDRKNPANAALNVYRASDGTWFVLIVTPDKVAAVAKAIGRTDLLTDPRFSDPQKLMANMPQLSAILDEVFAAQPMAHWYEVFSGLHVTFGAVRGPQRSSTTRLALSDIVVPLEERRRQADFNDQLADSGAWRSQGAGPACARPRRAQ